MRLVKENGGDFQMKKKKKKKESSRTKIEDDVSLGLNDKTLNIGLRLYFQTKPPVKQIKPNKKPPISSISKDDLGDYVEIALSFRMVYFSST